MKREGGGLLSPIDEAVAHGLQELCSPVTAHQETCGREHGPLSEPTLSLKAARQSKYQGLSAASSPPAAAPPTSIFRPVKQLYPNRHQTALTMSDSARVNSSTTPNHPDIRLGRSCRPGPTRHHRPCLEPPITVEGTTLSVKNNRPRCHDKTMIMLCQHGCGGPLNSSLGRTKTLSDEVIQASSSSTAHLLRLCSTPPGSGHAL